jgi:hypothetical protein
MMATHGLQFRKALGCQERGKFVWWRNGQESTTQNPGADVDAAGEDAFLTVAADRNCRRLGFRAGCLRFRQQHRDKDRRQEGGAPTSAHGFGGTISAGALGILESGGQVSSDGSGNPLFINRPLGSSAPITPGRI